MISMSEASAKFFFFLRMRTRTLSPGTTCGTITTNPSTREMHLPRSANCSMSSTISAPFASAILFVVIGVSPVFVERLFEFCDRLDETIPFGDEMGAEGQGDHHTNLRLSTVEHAQIRTKET